MYLLKKFLCTLLLIASAVGTQVYSARTSSRNASEGYKFQQAVEIIKKYETLHSPKDWPYIGYGHRVQAGEHFTRGRKLSEREADRLLRKDLHAYCALFRNCGKDSLLLGVLAYNRGPAKVKRSLTYQRLRSGNRNIREDYLAQCRYHGKIHRQLHQRRQEELNILFD